MKTISLSPSSDIPSWWLSTKACALLLAAGGSLTFGGPTSAAPLADNPATPEVGGSEVAPTDVNQEATGFDRNLVVGFTLPETERTDFRAVPMFLESAAQAPAEGQAAYLYKTNLYYVEADTFKIISIVDVTDQLMAEPALVEQMVVGYEVPADERPYLIERQFKGKMASEKPKDGEIVRVLNGNHVIWLDEQTYKITRVEKIAAKDATKTEEGSAKSTNTRIVRLKTAPTSQAKTPEADAKEATPKIAKPKQADPKEAKPKEANPKEADPKEAR